MNPDDFFSTGGFGNLMEEFRLKSIKSALQSYLQHCQIYWVEAKWHAEEVLIERMGLQFRNPTWRKALTFKQRVLVLDNLVAEFIKKNDEMTREYLQIKK